MMKVLYIRLSCLTPLLLVFCQADFAADQSSWPVDRQYRVQVQIDPASLPDSNHIPVSVDIDFEKLLSPTNETDKFTAHSIIVTAVEPNGSQTPLEHLADETFHKGPAGTISWIVPVSKPKQYYIYFDTTSHGPYQAQTYIPIIGVGDNFRYNRNDGLEPINAGLTPRPLSADFDGDGLVDLISHIIYYNTWRQPPFSLFFWRNNGSNEAPVYEDFVRLYDTEGRQLRCKYSGRGYGPLVACDWNNDGLTDLITEWFFYRNTGRLNPAGGILFERDVELPELDQKGDLRIISYTDHDGDGVKDLFYFSLGVYYTQANMPAENHYDITLYRRINTAPPNQKPVFLNTLEPVVIDGKTKLYNRYISDFWDIDGDGDLDLIGTHLPVDQIPSYPTYCYWLNIAPKGQAPIYGPPRTLVNFAVTNDGQSTLPLVVSCASDRFDLIPVNNAAYQGLFSEENNMIRYLKQTIHRPPGSIPAWTFEDRGLLCQRNARCAVGAFSGVDVADWENDGDWDIISGDEAGYIWLIENINNNQRPVFRNPRLLQADDQPMRIQRWNYLQDHNTTENLLGQTKPQCIDWDNDGDLDMIVGNDTDRIVFYENIGDRSHPQFAAGVTLRVGYDEAPWVERCRPAIGDFDGDSLPDVVTLTKQGDLCLFRRDTSASSRQLLPPQPLLYDDGKPIRNWNTSLTGANFHISKNKVRSLVQFEAADWDGDGDVDIISTIDESYNKKPAFWENISEGSRPRFKQPVELKCWNRQIMLCRHEQTYAAVDWFGSGKPDLVCGAESGWFYYFHRSTLDNSAPPQITVAGQVETKP